MTRVGSRLAVLMLLGAIILSLTPVADARQGPAAARASEVTWEEGTGDPGDQIERWWGVVGAAICGGEIRLILRAPAIGLNPYVLAAGIAGCTLAALDVLTTQ